MSLDISLILRKWAFDLDSEALGPIRIANVDMRKIFNENEAAIRAGELEGDRLARMLLEKMAHKLTGDEAVDKMCEGPTFERSELDLLTRSELDVFADTLIKGRLRFVMPKGSTSPTRMIDRGCAALSEALIAFANADRASRAAMAETWKKQISAVDQIEAQWKKTHSIAAGIGFTNSIMETERARAEKWSIPGVESIADKAVKDWKRRQDDQIQVAMGYGLDGGVANAIAQHERDRKLFAIASGTIHPSPLGFAGMSAAERIGMASGSAGTIAEYLRENDLASKIGAIGNDPFVEPVREMSLPAHVFRAPPPPPPNPVHATNKMMEELLGHQKEEAAKKEAESVTANATSTTGLRYTKLSFWVTLVAFVAPSICGTWVYFEQKAAAETAKAEAAESAKAAAAESAKQQAEIRELTAALRKSIELTAALRESKESKPRGDLTVKAIRAK